MESISKLYLNNTTTARPTTVTTTIKNKILNETVLNITTSSPLTKIYGHKDTIKIDEVTTASNVKPLNITSTFSSMSITNSTTNPIIVVIPSTTTSTEGPKSALVSNFTTTRSINPNITTTSFIPKMSTVLSNIVVNNQSNSSKIINTSSTNLISSISSSTTESLIKNKTISMTTILPNISSSISRPDKLNPTIRVISIPNVLINKSVVENSPLTTSTSVNFSNSTIKPIFSIVSTVKKVNSSSTATKYLMENSTPTTALINNSTKLSIKLSVPNNIEQSSNKSLITQQIKQNTTINESKTTLNNLTINLPSTVSFLNDSIVPNKKMMVFDTSRPNPSLKKFKYNQILNNKNVLNITTESYNYLDMRTNSIPFKNEKQRIVLKVHEKSELNNLVYNNSTQNFDNQLAEQTKQNGERIRKHFDKKINICYVLLYN